MVASDRIGSPFFNADTMNSDHWAAVNRSQRHADQHNKPIDNSSEFQSVQGARDRTITCAVNLFPKTILLLTFRIRIYRFLFPF